MNYGNKEFLEDLNSKEVQHTQSKQRFYAFYDELGKMPQQKMQKYRKGRMRFVKPKGKMLELGCHVGFNLIHYAKKRYHITGVDVSKTLLKEARRRISKQPKKIRQRILLFQGFIEEIKLAENMYDTIIMTELLEHVINPILVLAKAREFLTKDGLIYISCPTKKTGNNSHIRGIDRDEMLQLLQYSNLKFVKWVDQEINTACIAKK